MFFIDKYSPKKSEDALFHRDILKKLKVMGNDESVPHVIFYGPEGSGKKTLISLFLKMIYNESVDRLIDVDYSVSGSGNTSKTIVVKQSKHHIVIEPNNNNFDRYLIQDIVKEYAKRPYGLFHKKNGFRTVFINNVDNLSYYAQTSLRRTMEQCSSVCRFVMWSRSLSCVIDPLRSRCFCLRVPLPPKPELKIYLKSVTEKEKIDVTDESLDLIIDESHGNIKKSLWKLELLKLGCNKPSSYEQMIDSILHLIFTKQYFTINMLTSKDNILIKSIYNNVINISHPSKKAIAKKNINEKVYEVMNDILMRKNGRPNKNICNQIGDFIFESILALNDAIKVVNCLTPIRDRIYQILITNISGSTIIRSLTDKFMQMKELPFAVKCEIATLAAEYQHNLILCRREIFHLDAFIIHVIKLFKNHDINIHYDFEKICFI